MNQVNHTILIATATAEVAKRYGSFMDFDAAKTESREYMEAASKALGLRALYGPNEYEKGFESLRRDMLALFEQKATAEVVEAVREAEAEQRAHTTRLADLRKLHSEAMQMLADHHAKVNSADVGDDFARLINASREDMVQALERFDREFMGLVQMKHRMELTRCFTGHLISEETAKKLVELYEVK